MNQNAVNQVKKTLRNAIIKNELAGANLLVIKNGTEVFYHEDGHANIEAAAPIKRDTIFRLYSMSKPVTAAAVMILLERGEIDLYEPVHKFLPGFKNQTAEDNNGGAVPAARDMALYDLLSMTSGLVYGGPSRAGQETEALFKEIDDRLLGDHPLGTVEAMNKLGQCTLAFQPGASWQYGTSADALGAVVEAVSGKRFGTFLRDEIFTPLGMTDTGFWLEEEKRNRLAVTYASGEDGKLFPYSGNHLGIINAMDRDPAFESGGAGLVSTIDDYACFAKMLLNGGSLDGVQILRPKTVKYFASQTLNMTQRKAMDGWFGLSGFSYGNLMRVLTDTARHGGMGSIGEYGWDGWLGAYFVNCPADDLCFLFMMQKTDSGTTALTRKLKNIVQSVFVG